MSKKFEYELTLRLEKAEKAIASLASKIEKDLGKAVDAAFKGSSEFDFAKHVKNVKEIESSAKLIEASFRGASEFDFSQQARRIKEIESSAKAVATAFSGSSEFGVAKPDDLDKMKEAALALEKNQKDAEDYGLELYKRGRAERERIAAEEAQKLDARRDARKAADTEALQSARAAAAEKQRLKQEEFDRERQNEEGIKSLMQQSRAERERVAAEEAQRLDARREARKQREAEELENLKKFAMTQDQISREANDYTLKLQQDRDKAEEAHADRLEKNTKLLKDYYANYKDPAVLASIQAVEDNLNKHSESLKNSGKSLADQNKEHSKLTEKELDNLDRLVGKDKKASLDRIESIKNTMKADSEAATVRYFQHETVLKAIQQAEAENASELAALEARITNLTKQEAAEQIAVFQKVAKARIAAATEAGYKMEALAAQQAASGAKGVSAVFQVQQAVEDSMYAGLRGAANNIAFLLTSIANPWVAIGGLIAVATLQLADHLGVFEKINEAMDGALWKTKAQIREEEYLFRLKKEQFDRDYQNKKDEASFSPSKKTPEDFKKDLEVAREHAHIDQKKYETLKATIALTEKLKQKQNEADAHVLLGLDSTDVEKEKIARIREEIADIVSQIEALDVKFTPRELAEQGVLSKLGFSSTTSKALAEVIKLAEDAGSTAAASANKLRVLLDQEKAVLEANSRKDAMNWVQKETLALLDEQADAAKELVKSREEELRVIEKSLAAAEQMLKTEQNREDAIRKAASAREDEFAKQKLGLQNTILDMEANEKAKSAKKAASSAEEKVNNQLKLAKQWAENQAKVDKFNNKLASKMNPQINFDIDNAKQNWVNNLEAQAKAKIDKIKKTEELEIASAKKTAEIAKQANLDAMEVVQKQKVEDRIAEATRLHRQGVWAGSPEKAKERFDDAQDAMDKAQKALKEIADAKVGNLNQKDSVGQGKTALREWEELTKRIKALDEEKAAMSKEAQQKANELILTQKAAEDQANARLEAAKVKYEEITKAKQAIRDIPMNNPDDLNSVEKYMEALQRVLDLRLRILNVPLQVPTSAPGFGPAVGPGVGGPGTAPPAPGFLFGGGLPGPQFNMNFSMGSATPNSVAAAANAVVQTQKTLAMLGGN